MDLIHNRPVDVQPVQRPAIPAQRLELAERPLAVDVVLEHPQLPRQRRTLLHHPHRFLMHNPRLIAFRRRRVNLRPRLPIGRLEVQPDTRAHR